MEQVFISYARKDAAVLAGRLRGDLHRDGFEVWLDTNDIAGGDSWSEGIEQAIEKSDVVLALMSDASFVSEICRAEQIRALRKNKRVVPLLTQTASERPLYFEHLNYLDFSSSRSYTDGYTALLNTIKAQKFAQPLPFQLRQTRITAPPPPLVTVERPASLEAVRNLILGASQPRPVPVTGVRGEGGSGKTVIAQMLCLDPIIQAAFPDGIVWVKVGRDPSDIVAQIRSVGTALGDDPVQYATIDHATSRLRWVLDSRAVLLVLDDVWDARQVEPFRTTARRCRLLFTSRIASIASSIGSFEYVLGNATHHEALTILARWASLDVPDLPAEAEIVVKECGGLPLALAMIGAMLRGKPDRWPAMLEKLQNARLEKIQQSFPNYPYPNLSYAIQVSIDDLDPPSRARYLELAVFPEVPPIPESALELLWNISQEEVQETVDLFIDRSMARREDAGSIGVHDLQKDFLCSQFDRQELIELRERLIAQYRTRSAGHWPDQPRDAYFYSLLPYHLSSSGKKDELRKLLIDFEWLEAKLNALDVSALIADYDEFVDDADISLVQRAIRLSAHVLAEDRSQLASQLYARLTAGGWPDSDPFCAQMRRGKGGPWLRTMTPSLSPPNGPLFLTFTGHVERVEAVAVSCDGRRGVSGSSDGTILVWDIETGAIIRSLRGHTGSVYALATNASGQAISAAKDNTARIWNLETGEQERELNGSKFAISSDGCTLAIGTAGDVSIWDLKEEAQPRFKLKTAAEVTTATISPGGKYLAIGLWQTNLSQNEEVLSLYDLNSGESLPNLKGRFNVHKVGFTPDGEKIAAAGSGWSDFCMWDVHTGELLPALPRSPGSISSISFTPDSACAIITGSNHTLQVWRIEDGKELRTLTGHTDYILSTAVTKDGKRALSGSWDKTVRVWNLSQNAEPREYSGHAETVGALAFANEAEVVYSASYDGSVKLWSSKDFTQLASLKVHDGWVLSVAVTRDGERMLTGSTDGTAQYWDTGTGRAMLMVPHPWRALKEVTGDTTFVKPVTLSPDGRLALTVFDSSSVRVSDLNAAGPYYMRPKELLTRKLAAKCIKVFPDGKKCVTGGQDKVCTIWDLATGETIMTLAGHNGAVTAVAITASGDRVVTGSIDRSVRVWRVSDGKPLGILEHPAPVTSVALSEDDNLVLAGFAENAFSTGLPLNGCRLSRLSEFTNIATFYGESPVICCIVAGNSIFVAGETSGRLHFLRLVGRNEGFEAESPHSI